MKKLLLTGILFITACPVDEPLILYTPPVNSDIKSEEQDEGGCQCAEYRKRFLKPENIEQTQERLETARHLACDVEVE